MKKKLFTIIFAAVMIFAFNSINALAATSEEIEDVPQFYFTDEDGTVIEVVDFEYVDSFYIGTPNINARTVSFDNPDPETNYYDLEDGQYLYRNETIQSTYEMDKWFHANSAGKLYISAFVGDADGTLEFCIYRVNEDEVWHINIYTLNLHQYNSRARYYNGYASTLDKTGTKYYTTTAVADNGSFGFGVLKASWEEIDDLYDYDI